MYCVEKEREREGGNGLQCMSTAAWPGVENTGFVYADTQTVHLARPTYYTLFSLSIVKRKHL